MAKVKVLIEGYTIEEGTPEESACSTVTLVRDKDIMMIVDPGTLKKPRLLADKLRKEGLTIKDVNVVCITHSHMDHYRNIGMFPNAKALDYWGLWDGDKVKDWEEQFTPDIRIIKTPGHSYDGITLLVKTDKGFVAICGDVFWEKDFPDDDPYASDKERLEESRKTILELADWIIPGHGKMFRTPEGK